ncbi:MAG: hypothetical protein HON39_12150, partial [Marinovum sp.]|nr:hypothetical protein [Marinovum sp.]
MRILAIATFLALAVPATAQQAQAQASTQGGSFFSNLFSRPAPEAQPEYFQELGNENDTPGAFGQEPTLRQIILAEIHDYPKPLDELDLKQRKICLEELETIFD